MAADLARRGWASRCLREAMAELAVAKTVGLTPVLAGMCASAMRKAQMAIYYTLGSPSYLGPLVYRLAQRGEVPSDRLGKCLVELELLVQRGLSDPATLDRDELIRKTEFFIEVAKDFVDLYS